MKKLAIILIFAFLQTVNAHLQYQHQLITQEAYNLLKLYVGGDIAEMQNHMGTTQDIGDGPFKTGFILTGAWREDVEDVVYGFSNANPPTVTGPNGLIINIGLWFADLINDSNEAYSSVTHFWEPDDGDATSTTIQVYVWPDEYQFTVPNAYQKIRAYADGSWKLFVDDPWLYERDGVRATLSDFNGDYYKKFSYSSLIELYKTGEVKIKDLAYKPYYLRDENNNVTGLYPTNGTITLKLNDDTKNKVVWEILGRMCHLLQDMTIPAHVHSDAHGTNAPGVKEDPYEESFGPIQWTASQVQNNVGDLFDISNIENPIHYLMYTNAQMSDHFAGAGPYSTRIDDLIEGNYSTEEYNYLNSLNLSTWGEPTTFSSNLTSDQLTNMRNKLIPQAIRSTATLLYWFANEVVIIPQKCYLTFTNDFSGISETFNITVNSATEPAPTEPYEVIEGHTIQVEADQNRVYNNVFYEFSHWNDGNTNASRTITATQTETITAYYDAINPPTTPQGLTVSDPDEHPVLQWTASTGSDITYDIYRQVNYNGWGKIDYSTTAGYTDDGVTTTYRHGDDIYYKVMAVSVIDKDYELYSAYSNTVEIEARLEKNSNEEELVEEMPTEYALNSNYPNPFNPTTQISYQIPNDGFVNLTVYNSLGQEIAALVNQHQSIGRYTVQFNASNLSSGIYFYRIAAGEFNSVKKMLLVR